MIRKQLDEFEGWLAGLADYVASWTSLELIMGAVALYLIFRLVREVAYIRLYSLVLKLKADGKLRPENDPRGIADRAEADLAKRAVKWF